MYYFEKDVENGIIPKYKVTYPCHEMDLKPTIKLFEFEYEALDWSHEEVQRRIDFTVQHSADTVSEEEYKQIEEYEYYLVRVEEIQSCDVDFYAYRGV